jgi:hypothetical protein
MPRKSKPESEKDWDDPEESKRFLDAAKEAEASDDPDVFDRALKKIAPKKIAPKRSKSSR